MNRLVLVIYFLLLSSNTLNRVANSNCQLCIACWLIELELEKEAVPTVLRTFFFCQLANEGAEFLL